MSMLWKVLFMALALLTIGTSTDRIDLLSCPGFILDSWIPAAGDVEDYFQESSLADYRQLAAYRDITTPETFDLKLIRGEQDQAIAATQDMRRLLRLGRNYFASQRADLEPVYIAARAGCETNTRYAIVHAGRLPNDDNPFSAPFTGHRAGMDNLSLIVERGPWLENAPGTGTCVQISGSQEWEYSQVTVTSSPAQSEDDTWHYDGETLMAYGTVQLPLGYDATTRTHVGIRFPALNIPQGSIILSATVTFEAVIDGLNNDCNVNIWSQNSDDAAIFSDYADFHTRPLSPRLVPWQYIPQEAIGAIFSTPNIARLVQYVVSRPGWVANNALVVFLEDAGSTGGAARFPASWDHATAAAPVLSVTYATPVTHGRAATCLDEVYVANKHNEAQLTHAYHYTAIGAVWSANLMAAVLPYALLPAAPANNDIFYAGIQSTLTDSGPFASMVFDIGTAAVYVGAAHVHWQYSQGGGGWGALTVQDNTGDLQPFSVAGVGSIHWVQPSDWAPDTVNGITAYWVRAILQIGGGESISTPMQQNRYLYTIVWPFVEIQAAQVGGDLPALAEIHVKNVSDGPAIGGTNYPDLYSNRLLVGLRSVDRGSNYTPYINVCDEQKNINITVTTGGNTTIIDDSTAATGRCTRYNPAGVEAMGNRALIYIVQPLSTEYYDTFHVFLRARQSGGTAGNIGVQIRFTHGSGVAAYTTPTLYFANTNADQILDFGKVTIPLADLSIDELADFLTISIRASSTSGTPNLDIYELILFPSQELLFEGRDQANLSNSIMGQPGGDGLTRYLDIDSITRPRSPLRALLKKDTNNLVVANWRPMSNAGFMMLQANATQRLWFLSMRTAAPASTDERSEPEVAFSIQVWRVNRYASMRGNR